MKKRSISLLLALLMVLSLLPFGASAADDDILKVGGCGEYCTYTIYVNGKLEISGKGDMMDYVDYGSRISPFENYFLIKTVSIENRVTSIGSRTFYGCSGITSISIPEAVTSIGYNAFHGCSKLNTVYYSGSETEWNLIKISEGNEELQNANIIFSRNVEATPTPNPVDPSMLNGNDAFQHLKSLATKKGRDDEGFYKCGFSIGSGDSCSIEYDPSSDSIVLRLYYTDEDSDTITISKIIIPSSLTMPYEASFIDKWNNRSSVSANARIDHSFTKDSYLALYDGDGFYQNRITRAHFADQAALLLKNTQELCFADSGLSVGDLGFTAFADEMGYRYGAPTPTPTPTLTPTPTPPPEQSGSSENGAGAFRLLKEIALTNGVYSNGKYQYEFPGSNDRLFTVAYDKASDMMVLTMLAQSGSSRVVVGCTIEIPSSLRMPYDAFYMAWYDGERDATANALISSELKRDSRLLLYDGTGEYQNEEYGKLFTSCTALLLKYTQELCFDGSKYSIADLGFTAFAEEMGYTKPAPTPTPTPTPKPTPTPTPKPTPTPTPKPTPTPTPKPTPTPTPKPTPTPTPPPKPNNPFVDVAQSEYYYTPVQWAVNHNPQITNGTGANTFSPEATCTRDQIVTFLWRAMGCPEPTNRQNPFADVQSGDYFYKPVLWAVEKGITNGMDATHFGPAVPCSRAHVVTFLWRSLGKPGAAGNNPFRDVPSGQYYTDAVLWAVSKNITNGIDATHFGPDNPCQRGQIVTFLYRAKDIQPVSEPTETPAPTPIVTENKVFSYIKEKIVSNGERSDSGSYESVFFLESTEPVSYYIARYDPNTNTINFAIIVLANPSEQTTLILTTEFEVTPELKMPYLSKFSCDTSDSRFVYAEAYLDASYTSDTHLKYTMGYGPYTDEAFTDYYEGSLFYLLGRINENLLKNSGYTIADLGFTALADADWQF